LTWGPGKTNKGKKKKGLPSTRKKEKQRGHEPNMGHHPNRGGIPQTPKKKLQATKTPKNTQGNTSAICAKLAQSNEVLRREKK